MTRDEAILKAKKLKALRDKGTGPEAENAGRRLDELIQKHGLNERDFLAEIVRVFERTLLNESSRMLEKIIHSVVPDAKIQVEKNGTKLLIKVALTDVEYIEVAQKYEFFWKAYNEERELFLTAFFNKHYRDFLPESVIKDMARPTNYSGEEGRYSTPTAADASNQTDKQRNQQGNINNGSGAYDTYKQKGKDQGVPFSSNEAQRLQLLMSAMKKLKYMKTSRMLDSD